MNQNTIAHRWAIQWTNRHGQRYSKCCSMIYDRDIIYSWGSHWELARFVTLVDTGERIAVFNDESRSRSSSTSRHENRAYRALRGKSIRTPSVLAHLMPRVVDTPSLEAAVEETKACRVREAEEKRIRRNEEAKLSRERRAEDALENLSEKLEADVAGLGMSKSTAIKLDTLLFGVDHYVFGRFSYGRSRRSSENALSHRRPEILEVLGGVVREDPAIVKQPGRLFSVIENFKLLVA